MAATILNHIIQNINKPKPLPANSTVITRKILAHLKSGRLTKAVSVLFSSPLSLPFPLYAELFRICASNRAIVEARKLESHLITFTPTPPLFLLNRAIETYAKCGNLYDARELFDEMPKRDGGSWNAMINAYVRGGSADDAFGLFVHMGRSDVLRNEITFSCLLGCCGAVLDVPFSKQLHGLVVRYGFCDNVVVGTSLVDVYGKGGLMNDARRMFDEIPKPNAVSWNVIIRRYFEVGEEKEAVSMFSEMVKTDVVPLNFTLSTVLKACSRVSGVKEGLQIHGYAIKVNFAEDAVVSGSLIHMYCANSDLDSAHRWFFDVHTSKNLINWTSMVSGYVAHGRLREARELFDQMPERNVVSWNAMLAGYIKFCQWDEALDLVFLLCNEVRYIDHFTVPLILNVCAGFSDLHVGKQVHGFVYRHGFFSDPFVGNSLLHMYGTCGNLRSSRVWFHQMRHSLDVVSWNAILHGHSRHELSEGAMMILPLMLEETRPSKFSFATILAACADIFALQPGKQIHGYMLRNGYDIDIVLRGALLDMYSKCRRLDYALTVFRGEPSKDVILWNSMLLGCCHNKRAECALELFESMESEGIKPDNTTFQAILGACIFDGQVELGRRYFDEMSSKYCIIPRLEHYECIIDLYARYGFMGELENFVKKMPFVPIASMLTIIVDACRVYKNVKLGEWAADRLNDLSPSVPSHSELTERR